MLVLVLFDIPSDVGSDHTRRDVGRCGYNRAQTVPANEVVFAVVVNGAPCALLALITENATYLGSRCALFARVFFRKIADSLAFYECATFTASINAGLLLILYSIEARAWRETGIFVAAVAVIAKTCFAVAAV
jgi:hypothetical protein